MRSELSLTRFSMEHPKKVAVIMILMTIILGAFISLIKIDTDPENMLSEGEPVRVFHNEMKKEFSLSDMVVLGIVNEKDPDGVFNPDSLRKIHELTEYIKGLRWDDPENPGKEMGVIERDILSPSTVDNIESGGLGVVTFEWLMNRPPKDKEEALAIREKSRRIPFLNGTLISEDGKAVCLYIPLTSKDLSYRVYSELKKKIATFQGDEQYLITGLPVAEDTFGVEMFIQMAVSAPLAMLVIFILMLFFFRKLILIVSPMIVALVSVVCTMGLLISTGFTVHIMSSMIPIFIMPISVLDSIHILSEFFDRYQATGNRRETLSEVMRELFLPMLYTSTTSAAGFGSLALTPIPPVQVFGVFVAIGVMLAWLTTITFIPAYIMLLSEKTLENFGLHQNHERKPSPMTRMLKATQRLTFNRAKVILAFTLVIVIIAAWGISRIQINDNPTKWFARSHPIRVADHVLNEHFAGTYMAYLALQPMEAKQDVKGYSKELLSRLSDRSSQLEADYPHAQTVFKELERFTRESTGKVSSQEELLELLEEFVSEKYDGTTGEESFTWEEASLFIDEEKQMGQIFKDPSVLNYMEGLQEELLKSGVVGKSNSLADIVKTVHRELFMGKEEAFRVPESRKAIAQSLLTYQNSHRPHDLWHFVTPDYKRTSLWIQLKSGDNKDMDRVVKIVDEYMRNHPSPIGLQHSWFGLTYINVVWQEKMVKGMLQAFMGSFLIVFLMTTILFRSPLWGFLAMIPLTVTIGLIYGAVGILGKDYDMPVAVLSSLSLGLSVDFAIHFLSRSQSLHLKYRSWQETSRVIFDEPARAITRNVIVIAFGFLPLLAATLMPYKTVGAFLASILVISGAGTLIILPSLMRIFSKRLFVLRPAMGFSCNCALCLGSTVAAVLLIAINLYQYIGVGWTTLTWISVIATPLLAFGCGFVSRREKCKTY
ncbi:MAG: MMPL family transporter [Thermodesulfobacteriota bacterium]|nr:MMPL family transporter [Thermodesulfobacteriota bacterium]